MAEFLHNFTAGKMNKDYDERLVPNGEYRDALNLEVTDSDGSDIGVLQNVRGNKELINKYFNVSTGLFTPWTVGYMDVLVNPICIGSIVDNTTDKLYWFIASDYISVIAEYDQVKNIITPILVDTEYILKFSKSNLITGVNIIEGNLLWTDDNTEPKAIDIALWKALNTPTFATHTQIYGRPFEEFDIAVIKKSPLNSPSLTLASSSVGGPGTGISPVTTSYNVFGKQNFTYIPNPSFPTEYKSLPTYAEIEANPSGYPNGGNGKVTIQVSTAPTGWKINDVIKLKGSAINDLNESFEYELRLQIESISAGVVITAKILSISANILKFATPIIWQCLLEEKQPMFEFKFPRFAYRWKYKNNQFSCFSPFTNVAFLGNKFEYLSSDGYNTGMVNTARLISLSGIEWGDESVVEVEVLYKESDSSKVYKVDSIKNRSITTFDITSEVIGAMLSDSQIIRQWDNVPRKAKAQEIIGNRLMYGNYLQNYTVDKEISLSISERLLNHPDNVNTAPIGNVPTYSSTKLPYPSIKSIRTYQLGITYKDQYGRETPVLTSKNASVTVPKSSASYINKLVAKPQHTAPSWATHYKYFIKETANEYYNVALDRFYFSEDGNVWLSFPSSERNKFMDDSYIILKKQHDNDVYVAEEARYKVLAIRSEAPEFISTAYQNETTAEITAISGFQTGFLVLTFDGPTAGSNDNFYSGLNSSKYITISDGASKTDKYRIESGGPTGTGNGYVVYLKESLGSDASFLGTTTSATGPLTIDLLSKAPERLPEFEGRFFVKINRDVAFDANIVAPFKAMKKEYGVTSEILKKGNKASFANSAGDQWGLYFQSEVDCGEFRLLTHTDIGKFPLGNDFGKLYGNPTIGSSFISIIQCGMNNRDVMTGYGAEFINNKAKPGALVRLVRSNGETSVTPYRITEYAHGGYNRGKRDPYVFDLFGSWGATCGDPYDQYEIPGNYGHVASMKLDRPIDDPWALSLDDVKGYQIVEEIISDSNKLLSSTNPAIFETEPRKTLDLDLYYSVSNNFPIIEHQNEKVLDWYNCYTYGNGVESNRIRDDYNAVMIDKAPIVSSVLDTPYAEERKAYDIIYSGIFNSVSGVNNINQFIQGESITKSLNPYYGSIQALLARDTDLIAFCEDKILNILANKDALYNADGNAQLIASNNVLGQATPYVGEYGISKNPESIANYGFRVYFTDKARGTVLRLSRDGLEPIGDKGMSAFFFDNLPECTNLIGSFNDGKGSYNLTLDGLLPKWKTLLATGKIDRLNPNCVDYVPEGTIEQTTVTFKENAEGWTSRMSFIQEEGCSLNSIFYTFKQGRIWQHDYDYTSPYNNFYGVQYDSSVNVLINESPEVVKGFKTLNYTGSRQREYVYSVGDSNSYSIEQIKAKGLTPTTFSTRDGWYTNYIVTDLQEGYVKEFVNKEGKYFNYIKGMGTFFNTNCDNNVSSKEFAVQGIGRPISISGSTSPTEFNIYIHVTNECFY